MLARWGGNCRPHPLGDHRHLPGAGHPHRAASRSAAGGLLGAASRSRAISSRCATRRRPALCSIGSGACSPGAQPGGAGGAGGAVAAGQQRRDDAAPLRWDGFAPAERRRARRLLWPLAEPQPGRPLPRDPESLAFSLRENLALMRRGLPVTVVRALGAVPAATCCCRLTPTCAAAGGAAGGHRGGYPGSGAAGGGRGGEYGPWRKQASGAIALRASSPQPARRLRGPFSPPTARPAAASTSRSRPCPPRRSGANEYAPECRSNAASQTAAADCSGTRPSPGRTECRSNAAS